MPSVTIEVRSEPVTGYLQDLHGKLADLRPVLTEMGEAMLARMDERFARAQAPDGTPWAANSPVTIARYLGKYGNSHTKTGKLSKRGAARAGNKRPLQGETGSLRGTLHYTVTGDALTVGSPMVYAAVQQFGARARQFGRAPWGDIPARPFLPVTASGALDADEERVLLDILQDWLAGA